MLFAQRIAMLGLTSILILLANIAGADDPVVRRQGNFSDGGFYACGQLGGGTLFHRRVNLASNLNEQLQLARNSGCFTVVQLEDGSKWSQSTVITLLQQWLDRNDLSLIDVLIFSEEHPYNAASYLNPLYTYIKAHSDVPVYVWPSATLGPLGQADGYWYDYYGSAYSSFRAKAQQFLSTGKPLGICIDGSGCSDIDTAREQVMICKEFDIPAHYFVAESGSGSWNGWYSAASAVCVPWRNFVFSSLELQRRSRARWPLTAEDMFWGDIIELAGDYTGSVNYTWTGIGGATVYGFRDLSITGAALQSKDNSVIALDYQFWTALPLLNGTLQLTVAGDAEALKVEKSRCGKADDWQELTPAGGVTGSITYALGDAGREFRLRITLEGSGVSISGGQIIGSVSASPDGVNLYPMFYDGWRSGVRYQQNLDAGQWRTLGTITNPQWLEFGPMLAMRGHAGYAISSTVIQKFSSSQPLNNIVVRLSGSYNTPNLGGSFTLGISLDGVNVIANGVNGGEPLVGGTYRGTHTADLRQVAAFNGVQSFYIHMKQTNGSGINTNISSRLNKLEIDAGLAP